MILSTKQDTRSIQPLSLSKLFSYILRRSGFLPAGFFFVFHPSLLVCRTGPRGTPFAVAHSGPSHNLLRHRFAITCILRAPSRYTCPRVDKPPRTCPADQQEEGSLYDAFCLPERTADCAGEGIEEKRRAQERPSLPLRTACV